MSRIVIIDYGVGNLQSLRKAFAHCGVAATVSESAEEIARADGVVLPGVGSFEAGMRGLKLRSLTDAVQAVAHANRPVLGICLGAQLMLEKGFEFGEFAGLAIIPGSVVRLDEKTVHEKIPEVGWNSVYPTQTLWKKSIFQSFEGQPLPTFYFTHSYIFLPARAEHVFAKTRYGEEEFCSVIRKGNIYGCQFHPEKSGKAGLALIRDFIALATGS